MPTPLSQTLFENATAFLYFLVFMTMNHDHLDFERPDLESPSTRIRDKCKHRQANETPCSVRINDDI